MTRDFQGGGGGGSRDAINRIPAAAALKNLNENSFIFIII